MLRAVSLVSILRSECGGTRWRTGGEVKGKLGNGVGSQYSHTASERGVSSITNADAHTSAASSRLNWLPRRFKRTCPFRRKTKSGFCACAIRFRTSSKTYLFLLCTLGFLKHVIEGKVEGRIEVTRRRGRRRKQLVDDLKEKRGYWKLKEEALDRTLWRTRSGRVYGPVIRQTIEWMNGDLDPGRSGVRIPSAASNFAFLQNVPKGSEAQPDFYWVGTGVLSREWSGGGVNLTTNLQLTKR